MSIGTPYSRKNRNSKVFAGLLLLAVGGILLLKQLDLFFFPYWLFSWPMFLIVIGLYIGSKHNFQKPSWLVLVLIGSAFLLDDIFGMFELRHLIWPVIIISLGIWMIFKRNHARQPITWDARMDASQPATGIFDETNAPVDPLEPEYTKEKQSTPPPHGSNPDFFDSTSVFGGVKRTILSKNFKGGDIVNVFGGTEIDLSQADFTGRAVIDITQLFGGIKLIVPPHWQVVSELAAVFSNVDDKRRVFSAVQQAPDKILVLRGTSILAGVDIRTY